jgi:hypothetical protein
VRTATRYLKMEKIDMASSVCVGSRARWVLRLGVSQWENKKSPDIDVGARTCLPIQAGGGRKPSARCISVFNLIRTKVVSGDAPRPTLYD